VILEFIVNIDYESANLPQEIEARNKKLNANEQNTTLSR